MREELLCPILRLSRAVQQVHRFVPDADDLTPLCSIKIGQLKFITQSKIRDLLWRTCKCWGGESRFGFNENQIGNKSLRLGAAMALFLKNHLSNRIMILGRWESKAFLDYIRPQIVEWTDLFSEDMIAFDNYFELFINNPKKIITKEPCEKHFNIPELCM